MSTPFVNALIFVNNSICGKLWPTEQLKKVEFTAPNSTNWKSQQQTIETANSSLDAQIWKNTHYYLLYEPFHWYLMKGCSYFDLYCTYCHWSLYTHGYASFMNNECAEPIAYISRKFSTRAAEWDTHKQESYAIYYCVKKLQYLLRGKYFELETDHRNLQ